MSYSIGTTGQSTLATTLANMGPLIAGLGGLFVVGSLCLYCRAPDPRYPAREGPDEDSHTTVPESVSKSLLPVGFDAQNLESARQARQIARGDLVIDPSGPELPSAHKLVPGTELAFDARTLESARQARKILKGDLEPNPLEPPPVSRTRRPQRVAPEYSIGWIDQPVNRDHFVRPVNPDHFIYDHPMPSCCQSHKGTIMPLTRSEETWTFARYNR
ncbi:hypothetical protein V8F20_012737 [Naviculisporaceae sp. PSN 640]